MAYLKLFLYSLALVIKGTWDSLTLKTLPLNKRNASTEENTLISISTHPWNGGVWQRPHHILTQLSKKYKILYCQPVFLWVHIKSGKKIFFLKSRTSSSVDSNQIKMLDIMLISGENLAWIRYINERILAAAIKKEAKKIGFQIPVLWFYAPQFAEARKFFTSKLLVYDIMDEYSAFSFSPAHTRKCEEELLKDADVVFSATDILSRRKKIFNDNIHFFPCAVDIEHFAKANLPETEIPADLKKIKPPILGYFGSVDERIDVPLLRKIAECLPEVNIVLIGPVLQKFSDLAELKNMHLLGLKSYQDLPAYLKAFTICLMPFRRMELTEHIHPTKLLEYLGARKPVISVNLPDVEKYYKDFIRLAKDQEQFLEQIQEEIAKPDLNRVEQGYQYVQRISWPDVAREMQDLMTKAYQAKYE